MTAAVVLALFAIANALLTNARHRDRVQLADRELAPSRAVNLDNWSNK